MSGIAFFDFDNTLIHGDIGPLFGRHLVEVQYEADKQQHGRKVAQRNRAKLIAQYLPYFTWMGAQSALYKVRAVRRSQVVRNAYRALKGIPVEDYDSHIQAFVDDRMPKLVYPEMMEILRKHLDQGDTCVIITTGAERIVRAALHHMPGPIELMGCKLHEADGKLTGTVEGPLYGVDKANMMRAYTKARGVDLQDCYAYTDHYSDFHMLELVGHPHTVNPRGRLRMLAKTRGWAILEPQPRT